MASSLRLYLCAMRGVNFRAVRGSDVKRAQEKSSLSPLTEVSEFAMGLARPVPKPITIPGGESF
jgi:hypothetical protein